jgi:hypothetical protein
VIAVPGIVGELFDLAALKSDYEQYLLPLDDVRRTGALDAITAELDRLAPLHTRELSSFLDHIEVCVHAGPGSTDEKRAEHAAAYVRCGLLLGYPPCTTAAMILAVYEVSPYGFN